MSFDLDMRSGWPDELRVLLDEHPRRTWAETAPPMARFWLERHDAFRRQCESLIGATDEYRAGRIGVEDFAVRTAARVETLVAHLYGHHQIEDFHYFPAFREAEPRLIPGFEALEKDHHTLHGSIADMLEALRSFLAAAHASDAGNRDAARHAADAYVRTGLLLYRRLERHLEDEEDLIVPVMLEQG